MEEVCRNNNQTSEKRLTPSVCEAIFTTVFPLNVTQPVQITHLQLKLPAAKKFIRWLKQCIDNVDICDTRMLKNVINSPNKEAYTYFKQSVRDACFRNDIKRQVARHYMQQWYPQIYLMLVKKVHERHIAKHIMDSWFYVPDAPIDIDDPVKPPGIPFGRRVGRIVK